MNEDQRWTWESVRQAGRSRYLKRNVLFWAAMIAGPTILCRISFISFNPPRSIPDNNLMGSIAVILYLSFAVNYALFALRWRLKEAAFLKEAEIVPVIDFSEHEPKFGSWLGY